METVCVQKSILPVDLQQYGIVMKPERLIIRLSLKSSVNEGDKGGRFIGHVGTQTK